MKENRAVLTISHNRSSSPTALSQYLSVHRVAFEILVFQRRPLFTLRSFTASALHCRRALSPGCCCLSAPRECGAAPSREGLAKCLCRSIFTLFALLPVLLPSAPSFSPARSARQRDSNFKAGQRGSSRLHLPQPTTTPPLLHRVPAPNRARQNVVNDSDGITKHCRKKVERGIERERRETSKIG